MKAIGVALLGPLALVACAAGGEHAASRVDSAGIEIVTSSAEDLPAPWTVDRVGTIGGSPSDTLLVSGADDLELAAGSDRFYVLDRRAYRVAMVDTLGWLLGSFGKEGDGPGEMRTAMAVAVGDNGDVTLLDMGRGRLISFSATGEPLGDDPIPPAHMGTFRLGHLGPDLVMDRRVADSTSMAMEVVIVSRGDSGVLASLPLPEMRMVSLHACGMEFQLPAMPILSPGLNWSSSGDWLAVVSDAAYDVRVFHTGGAPRRLRRTVPPREATEEIALQAIGEAGGLSFSGGDCSLAPEEMVDKMGVADRVPAIQDVLIDSEGWLRVQRYSVGDEPVQVDVFNPDGEYVGTMSGEHPMPDAASGNYIATAVDDSLGLPTIVISRIDGREN